MTILQQTGPETGGPAFPSGEAGAEISTNGMTLRDWFAGQALAGLCANGKPHIVDGVVVTIQLAAYIVADAMLAQRKGGQK